MDFFQHQDQARRQTALLVLFFSLAVISLVVLTNLLVMFLFGFIDSQTLNSPDLGGAFLARFDWQTFFGIGAVVIAVILLGSLYKIHSLSRGGDAVAEMLGGQRIVDGSGDLDRQKVLNVVEEMAIASGTPVPPVYLIDEDGINAFAAGFSPGDAVIGVTRGCIRQLNREQLQGVIAHEFSHILNGDMRLNIRLMGILHGILILGLIGYFLLRGGSHRHYYQRSSRNSGSGAILGLGLGLVVIGYTGTFFGNLIKAAVSRQREFLADASAVQFTRSNQGIAGALKRIGGSVAGSRIE
ncbi:MAG TPA: heat-shock protein HtpX, partial [Aliiroseovarius sp.]|nr:heat-shock protein HtpX [Aliiroseovarius sp.]